MPASDPAASTLRLLSVMARLLGPDGCPWDRVQTHHSLVPYLLEETCELIEAIESPQDSANRSAAMAEELGDVLLQVVFHSRLAEQAGSFTFAEVAERLAAKLIDRHPHVFSHERLTTPDQVSDAWERRKLAARNSRMDGIPTTLPALMRAQKVSSRAAKAGFDWNRTDDILAKAHEELDEFAEALKGVPDSAGNGSRDAIELELGDLLFAAVQLARWSGVDAERALRRSTDKFAARFRHMEAALAAEGRDPGSVDTKEWWELWKRAKEQA